MNGIHVHRPVGARAYYNGLAENPGALPDVSPLFFN
jgi:hypothetical protein